MNPAGVLFVVVEAGGQWPAWLSKLQRVVHDVVVVAADRDGTPAELALRVLHRLQALEASKDRAQMAVVYSEPWMVAKSGEKPTSVSRITRFMPY